MASTIAQLLARSIVNGFSGNVFNSSYDKDNFVHVFVDGGSQLELVLELHGRARLTEYIRR